MRLRDGLLIQLKNGVNVMNDKIAKFNLVYRLFSNSVGTSVCVHADNKELRECQVLDFKYGMIREHSPLSRLVSGYR
jgi:hypothetical protein